MGLQADQEGFSELALGDASAPGNVQQPGDDRLLVRFYTRPVPDEEATRKIGAPQFKDAEYISIMVPGNKDSMIDDPATDIHRRRFPRHYQAFKDRVSQEALSGMPLSEWPGITRSQVEALAFQNIKTVEQLAEVADVHAQGIMGVQMLKQRAKAYLEARGDNAAVEKLAHTLQERDERIAGLEATISEMAAQMKQMQEAMAQGAVPDSNGDHQSGRRRAGPDPSV